MVLAYIAALDRAAILDIAVSQRLETVQMTVQLVLTAAKDPHRLLFLLLRLRDVVLLLEEVSLDFAVLE